MEQIQSPEELMDKIEKMNRDNSVCQVLIPGKGKFTIVLQEEDFQSIDVEVKSDKKLKQMIQDSRESYKKGNAMTTTDFIFFDHDHLFDTKMGFKPVAISEKRL